jgi:hypothetical protein
LSTIEGTVICDVLDQDTYPRYLPLPLEAIRRDDQLSDPTLFRDIAVVGGRLTLVELRHAMSSGQALT